MGRLCVYIPPFAADYSGVCSVFFDFDCLTAINDANCCTAHYVSYDEPRWTDNRKTTFCTSLRTIDAILGNDNKVVKQISEASKYLESEMIAVVGTPVPALIGMDMDGIAHEIEAATGKVTFGFNTTGFDYYNKGIVLAGKNLFERFACSEIEVVPHSLNILGITPIDFGNVGNDQDLRNYFQNSGWTVNGCYFMGTSLDEVKRVGAAEVNLAVTSSGLELAKYLEAQFGTPYVAACPAGNRHANYVLDCLEHKYALPIKTITNEPQVLIVTDQIMGNSIRDALRLNNCNAGIAVASFFGWSDEIAEPTDTSLGSEKQLIELVRNDSYHTLVGDPYLWRFPGCEGLRTISIAHPAVSSVLTKRTVPVLLSEDFDGLLADITDAVNNAI